MKRCILIFCALILLPSVLEAQAAERWTLEDIVDSRKFAGDSLRHPAWIPDAGAFTFLKDDPIILCD